MIGRDKALKGKIGWDLPLRVALSISNKLLITRKFLYELFFSVEFIAKEQKIFEFKTGSDAATNQTVVLRWIQPPDIRRLQQSTHNRCNRIQ